MMVQPIIAVRFSVVGAPWTWWIRLKPLVHLQFTWDVEIFTSSVAAGQAVHARLVTRLLSGQVYSLGRQWHRHFESCSWLGCLGDVATWMASSAAKFYRLYSRAFRAYAHMFDPESVCMCIIHSMCP